MQNIKKQESCVVYIRVSTEDQKSGLSLDVQTKLCKKRAADEGYNVLEVLDDGGLSGFKANRDGITRIKDLIEQKKIVAIVALSSDRLFRNVREHIALRDLIFAKNIRIIYTHQASPENNAASIMQDTMLASVNQYYRDQISDKVKVTLYAKAEEGYFPSVPSPGYINADNPDPNVSRLGRKIIIPDPIAAPLITELFRLYATGTYSVYDLADQMSERGLRSHKGFKLSPSRVYDLLRNRIYIGEVHWGKVENKNGKHEPLIDEATFEEVQHVLDTHNRKACRRRKYEWLLSGFVYCANHHKRYVAEWH